ncbi:MAG: TetR/AcrR family transcriptional regulator [Bacillota bacterium]|nr:TetR/AcrR family transcriptional regulator [Bacillota bacterium]
MQYQKDEVRDRIILEGLKEFNEKGFKDASIRCIAKNANTSVGNIYKYFDSKEDLYESIIGEVYEKLTGYINQFKKVELNEKAEIIFYGLMDKILEVFNQNNIELSVLLNRSEGSKYENCKSIFVGFITRIVTEKVEYDLSLQGKILRDNFVIYLISFSLVESISIILREKQNGEEVRKHSLTLIDIFYKDIIDKVDSEVI